MDNFRRFLYTQKEVEELGGIPVDPNNLYAGPIKGIFYRQYPALDANLKQYNSETDSYDTIAYADSLNVRLTTESTNPVSYFNGKHAYSGYYPLSKSTRDLGFSYGYTTSNNNTNQTHCLSMGGLESNYAWKLAAGLIANSAISANDFAEDVYGTSDLYYYFPFGLDGLNIGNDSSSKAFLYRANNYTGKTFYYVPA